MVKSSIEPEAEEVLVAAGTNPNEPGKVESDVVVVEK